MPIEHKAPLTSSEIGILWIQYMGDTMALCLEKFHVAKEQDSQVRTIYQDAVLLMEKTTAQIRQLFQNECIPLTQGFTDADVNLEAPPLYSVIYQLQYFKYEMNLRLMANGHCMGESSRADVRNFYMGFCSINSDSLPMEHPYQSVCGRTCKHFIHALWPKSVNMLLTEPTY